MSDKTSEPLPPEQERLCEHARSAKFCLFLTVLFLVVVSYLIPKLARHAAGFAAEQQYLQFQNPLLVFSAAGLVCNVLAIVYGWIAKKRGYVGVILGVILLPFALLIFTKGLLRAILVLS